MDKNINIQVEKQMEVIKRGVVEIIPEIELKNKIYK